jgi:DNA-binding CsgD family transcriptional regulator
MKNSLLVSPDNAPGDVRMLSESEVESILHQFAEFIDVAQPQVNQALQNAQQEIVVEVAIGSTRYVLTRTDQLSTTTAVALSPREKEIVRLAAKGLPNKVISDILEISRWTVATHMRRIFAKLGVNTRAEMVARALENRLLDSQR